MKRCRRFLKPLAVLAVVTALAVGCSSDGFPVSYDDQIDAETGLSNVEQNWLDSCTPVMTDEFADEAQQVCECVYGRIRTEIPFESFVSIDNDLDGNIGLLNPQTGSGDPTARQMVEFVKGCIASA